MPTGLEISSQKKGAGKRGADEFGRFVGGHGNDGDDGDPAAKLDFAEQGDGVANAANFGAEPEQRGIEIAEQFVDDGRILFEQVLYTVQGKLRGGNGLEQAEVIELVSGNVACGNHGGFAEKITLEKGVAQGAGFAHLALGFHLFGDQLDASGAETLGHGTAEVAVGGTEVYFEEFSHGEERLPFWVVDEIVQGEVYPEAQRSRQCWMTSGEGTMVSRSSMTTRSGGRRRAAPRWRAASSRLIKALA
jgi:hypothetical protein